MVTDFELIQWLVLYATALFFSSLAVTRETLLTGLTASLLWIVVALFNFILAPTMLGVALSWILGLLGFLFAGVFMFRLLTQFYDTKYKRFETGPV
jgi:hypothetical protein